jgi:hypothetical protein
VPRCAPQTETHELRVGVQEGRAVKNRWLANGSQALGEAVMPLQPSSEVGGFTPS